MYDVSCLKLSQPRRLALVSANLIAKWPSIKSGQFKVISMQYLHMVMEHFPSFFCEIYHLKYFQFGGNSNSSTANIQSEMEHMLRTDLGFPSSCSRRTHADYAMSMGARKILSKQMLAIMRGVRQQVRGASKHSDSDTCIFVYVYISSVKDCSTLVLSTFDRLTSYIFVYQ